MSNLQHSDDDAFTDPFQSVTDASRNNALWEVPSGYFESRAALLEDALQPTLRVGDDYFDARAAKLEHEVNSAAHNRKGRLVRMWIGLAAACATGVVLMLNWKEEKRELSFVKQLEESQLEYEDLNEIEFDESVFEEFIVEDTIVADTMDVKKTPTSVEDFKPSKGQHVITWDDIDAEDIEEYLKEEQSLNIIDDI